MTDAFEPIHFSTVHIALWNVARSLACGTLADAAANADEQGCRAIVDAVAVAMGVEWAEACS